MLTNLQSAILSIVDRFCGTDSGFTTCELAFHFGRQPGHETNSQHSALILRELRALEAAGKVRRLDDKTPIVWCRA